MTFLSSARSVAAIKDAGYHRCGDGLYLQVSKSGSKSWVFRFKSPVTVKAREMGLGSYIHVSLADARELAHQYKRKVINGLDPLIEKKKHNVALQLEQARAITFKEAALSCIEVKKPEWSNAKHSSQWTNTLTTYIFPSLGHLPISEIETEHILRALSPIWTCKAETASRVRQRVEVIWDWAKALNYVTGENPARLKGHLDKLLPKTSRIKKVRHHPALHYNEISDFIQILKSQKGVTPLALEFLILTAARTNEVLKAKWNEISYDEKVWTIPAVRMKARRAHRVPLSKRCLDILQSIQTNQNSEEYIFPGWTGSKSLSNGAFLSLLRRFDYQHITPHGFRSTFRDWAAEQAHTFQNETVELALAHKVSNATEAAYRRGDQLERRRKLMNAWSDHIGK